MLTQFSSDISIQNRLDKNTFTIFLISMILSRANKENWRKQKNKKFGFLNVINMKVNLFTF